MIDNNDNQNTKNYNEYGGIENRRWVQRFVENWTAGLLCREFRFWCAYCTRTRNFRTVEPLLESNLARFSKQKSGVWKSG